MAKVGMTSIHLPMIAYLNYVDSDFRNAEIHLKESIRMLKFLIKNNIEDCKIAALEQYFNLFKVYTNQNRINESADIALNILLYVTDNFSELIDFSLVSFESINEQLNVLHYYINGILKVLVLENKNDSELLRSSKTDSKYTK